MDEARGRAKSVAPTWAALAWIPRARCARTSRCARDRGTHAQSSNAYTTRLSVKSTDAFANLHVRYKVTLRRAVDDRARLGDCARDVAFSPRQLRPLLPPIADYADLILVPVAPLLRRCRSSGSTAHAGSAEKEGEEGQPAWARRGKSLNRDAHDGVDAQHRDGSVGTVPQRPPRASEEVVDLCLLGVEHTAVLALSIAHGQLLTRT